MKTAERLRRWRVDAGLRQADAAKRIGADQGTWSRIESGKQAPSLAQAARIALATNGIIAMTDWLPKRERPADSPPSDSAIPLPDDAA